jgi:hypothetical protein
MLADEPNASSGTARPADAIGVANEFKPTVILQDPRHAGPRRLSSY